MEDKNKEIEKNSSITNRTTNLPYIISGIAILVTLFILLNQYGAFTSSGNINGNVISNVGDVQVIQMKVSGSNYVLEPSEVKKGVPVRIEADLSQMPGCSKSVRIPAFNINKNLVTGSNVIEFTPDKAGTFNIACSMNMYKGTLTVLDSDGSKSTYAEPASTAKTGCSMGAGGGGCGCGR